MHLKKIHWLEHCFYYGVCFYFAFGFHFSSVHCMFDVQDPYKVCLPKKFKRIIFDWNWKHYPNWNDFEHYIFKTLCNCLCSSFFSFSRFSANHIWDFGIANRYSWFWRSLTMADRGGEFSFFQGNHLRTDMSWYLHFLKACDYPGIIYLFKLNNINTRTMCEICSKLSVQSYLHHWRRSGVFIANFEQISHIVHVVDFEQINTRGHQIWQACTSRGIDSSETNETGAGDIINSWSRDKIKTLYLHYHSPCEHQTWQMVTYLDGFMPIKLHDSLIRWLCEIMW